MQLSPEEKERIKADEWERTKWRLLYTPLYVTVGWLTLIVLSVLTSAVVLALFALAIRPTLQRVTNQNKATSQSLPFAPKPTPRKSATPLFPRILPTPTATPKRGTASAPQVDIRKTGEAFRIGQISFKANSIIFRDSVGLGVFEKGAPAGSIYVVINLQILNEGKQAKEIPRKSFQFIDSTKRIFDVTTDLIHGGAGIELMSYSENLQPGVPWNGYLIFRVPVSVQQLDAYLAITLGAKTELIKF